MSDRTGIRINKYLAEAGLASRRTADRLIEEGRVTVLRSGEGEAKAEPGMRLGEGDRVFVDGREITGRKERKVYLMLNKPKGLVCTADPDEEANVIRFVDYPVRLTYAGRLDKDSRGLLLLTNDGELIHKMMKAAHGHEKEYVCRMKEAVTESFLEKLRRGVVIRVPDEDHVIHRVKTRPCRAERIDDHTVSITLTQGLNRQIRRMCFALGQQVTDLKRVRIMTLSLGDLEEGHFRELTNDEVLRLKTAAGSTD